MICEKSDNVSFPQSKDEIIKQLREELEIVNDPIYCKCCGAYGEPGCCPPDRCHCLYGEAYKIDYEHLLKENSKIDASTARYCRRERFSSHLLQTSHG